MEREISKQIDKILIIKPSSLGDIVHGLPLLNRIRNSLKDAIIHWVVDRAFKDLLDGHPMIDRLWVINKDEWKNINKLEVTITELKKLFKYLRAERYDLVIDLQGLLRSGIISRATGSRFRLGFLEAREGATLFYTHTVKGGRDLHAVERYLRVADFLELEDNGISFPFPPLPQIKVLRDYIKEEYAIIAPGARWPSKRWPPERFGRVASLLPLRSIVIGSTSDISLADVVVNASKGRAVSIAGKTGLKELIAIIKGARFMLCNDSGPMHIAAALGIPVIAIFGPTDPLKTGPYGEGHIVIRDRSCLPCRKRRCGNWRCMTSLEAGKVYDIIKEKWEMMR